MSLSIAGAVGLRAHQNQKKNAVTGRKEGAIGLLLMLGQMTGATSPDGTTLGYSYDAAHRPTGLTDAKGNTVTHTLDNMGNRTGEQVKDPSGTLQRNITRVYDALNRVQQVTGASN